MVIVGIVLLLPLLLWRLGHSVSIKTQSTIDNRESTIASDPDKELWAARYETKPGDKDSEPTAMVVDVVGNIYVTGFIDTQQNDVDYLTLKYAPSGKLLWEQRYNGPGKDLDRAASIALDHEGNVYVTGESAGNTGNGPEKLSNLDFATIKYRSSDGKPLWVKRYDGPAHGRDSAVKLAVDPDGHIDVLGYSWSGTSESGEDQYEMVLIQYDTEGHQRWVCPYHSPNHGADKAKTMVIDQAGNIYVLGENSLTCTLLKYDENGHKLWERHYAPSGSDGYLPIYLAYAPSGSVYVAGYIQDRTDTATIPRRDYLVLKYSANGDPVWTVRTHERGCSTPASMVVDSKENVYVTGVTLANRDHAYYSTIQLKPDGRYFEWFPYQGAERGFNEAKCIAVGSRDNLYITGTASYVDRNAPAGWTARYGNEYATITFNINGGLERVRRYAGPTAVRSNMAKVVAVDR